MDNSFTSGLTESINRQRIAIPHFHLINKAPVRD